MPENRFKALFEKADEAFDGAYSKELNELSGLSREEIDELTPCTTDRRTYNVLTKVVEDASRKNLSQAELSKNIRELGDLAVSLAKKVPSLAAIL